MDEAMVQAYARLTAHEFAIEVMMANWVASMPEEAASHFLEEFANKTKTAWVREPMSSIDPSARAIVNDAAQMSVMLVEKVAKRASEIRKSRA